MVWVQLSPERQKTTEKMPSKASEKMPSEQPWVIPWVIQTRGPGEGGETQPVCLCALSFSLIRVFLVRVWLSESMTQVGKSLEFEKVLKLSINFILWVRHADFSHVFRPMSLLNDSVPFPKVGMGPEMITSCDRQSLSLSSRRVKPFFQDLRSSFPSQIFKRASMHNTPILDLFMILFIPHLSINNDCRLFQFVSNLFLCFEAGGFARICIEQILTFYCIFKYKKNIYIQVQ